jgi:hypothetical protein
MILELGAVVQFVTVRVTSGAVIASDAVWIQAVDQLPGIR